MIFQFWCTLYLQLKWRSLSSKRVHLSNIFLVVWNVKILLEILNGSWKDFTERKLSHKQSKIWDLFPTNKLWCVSWHETSSSSPFAWDSGFLHLSSTPLWGQVLSDVAFKKYFLHFISQLFFEKIAIFYQWGGNHTHIEIKFKCNSRKKFYSIVANGKWSCCFLSLLFMSKK